MSRRGGVLPEPEVVTGEVVDSLDAQQIVLGLKELGLSDDIIAAAAEVPVRTIRSITSKTTIHVLAPEDEQIAAKMRRLANRAYEEAMLILEFGPSEQKLRIISTVLSNASRLIGQGSGAETHDTRTELDQLYANMRIDASTRPALGPTHDQDEAARA